MYRHCFRELRSCGQVAFLAELFRLDYSLTTDRTFMVSNLQGDCSIRMPGEVTREADWVLEAQRILPSDLHHRVGSMGMKELVYVF
jgi:hypothetical protein